MVRGEIDMHRAFAGVAPDPLDDCGHGEVSTIGFLLLQTRKIDHHILLRVGRPGGVVGE